MALTSPVVHFIPPYIKLGPAATQRPLTTLSGPHSVPLQRYKICVHHATLPSMFMGGENVRFCQQVGGKARHRRRLSLSTF